MLHSSLIITIQPPVRISKSRWTSFDSCDLPYFPHEPQSCHRTSTERAQPFGNALVGGRAPPLHLKIAKAQFHVRYMTGSATTFASEPSRFDSFKVFRYLPPVIIQIKKDGRNPGNIGLVYLTNAWTVDVPGYGLDLAA
jgi:hypothetical protein